MTQFEINDYLINLPNVWIDYPFGENIAVYKIGDKMVALITKNSQPLRVSLRCDPLLSETLQRNYETVMPGENLNKKQWITIVCTGQVPDDELRSLILLSYNLVFSAQ